MDNSMDKRSSLSLVTAATGVKKCSKGQEMFSVKLSRTIFRLSETVKMQFMQDGQGFMAISIRNEK